MNYFCTFGQGQYEGILRDFYIEVSAPSQDIAQKLMKRCFANKWSMCYSENEWRSSEQPTLLKKLARVEAENEYQFTVHTHDLED